MSKKNSLIKEIDIIGKCLKINDIEDITKQWDYDDEIPNGKNDKKLVACGQDGSYSELEYIYKEELKDKVEDGHITEKNALKALCICCHNLVNPRSRDDYYRCLEKELNITL